MRRSRARYLAAIGVIYRARMANTLVTRYCNSLRPVYTRWWVPRQSQDHRPGRLTVTRQDYVRIAAAIRSVSVAPLDAMHDQGVIGDVADAIADALAADNPRFDRERFLTACGVIGGA